jgi:DNA-binding NtrC family response regulator
VASAKNTLRCLVADDEPQIGSLVREALALNGYAADVVGDGEAALERLGIGDYVVGVFDVLMPLKTGVELAHELRRRGNAIPIVLMSSNLSEEVLASCSTIEHLSFLQKPFGLNDLRLAVDRAVAPVRC